MDDYDRDSNASSDNEHEPDDDATMQDVDAEEDNENQEHDEDEDDNDNEDDEEDDQDDEDATQTQQTNGATTTNGAAATSTSSGTPNLISKWQLNIRKEYLEAKTYDIVPTMAAPMATSINCMAITPDLRYWITGGSDGYIRKHDGPSTINGKTLLTVAQRHPFVDSVVKAGALMSYWANTEPQAPTARQEEPKSSPVYSLAVHSQALWLLSGLESGGINLQSVRHDEGKRITCLQKHTNAVSVLALAPDEFSVLSGSWDKNIFDWDLNTGLVSRTFDGSGNQISAIETRPMGGAPIPPEASEEEVISDTFFSNNGQPGTNGDFHFGLDDGLGLDVQDETKGPGLNGDARTMPNGADGMGDGPGSPGHDSLFGGSPTGGSDLFGDNDGMSGFGGDDDNEFSRAMRQDSRQDGDVSMGDYALQNSTLDAESGPAPAVQPPVDSSTTTQPRNSRLFDDNNLDSFNGDTAAYPNNANTTANGASSSLQPLPDYSLSTGMDNSDTSFPMGPADATQPQPVIPAAAPQSPSTLFAAPPPTSHDMTQTSGSTFLSASIDGSLRIWDRRVPNPVARIGNRPGIPPWCMGACWSPDGNWIYAGRRNGTVEEFNIHRARSGWQPERVFKLPGGSGPVTCVRPMVNGRHLVCASYDILRLYDLRADNSATKHSPPPFLIIPGPPRAGVISQLYVDPSSRFMLSTGGNRGWEGSTTEVLIGYEINVSE